MKIMFGVSCFQIFHASSLFLDKASSSMLLAKHIELNAQETSNRYVEIYIIWMNLIMTPLRPHFNDARTARIGAHIPKEPYFRLMKYSNLP